MRECWEGRNTTRDDAGPAGSKNTLSASPIALSVNGGDMASVHSKQYRVFADRCIALANNASDRRTQSTLLDIARGWIRLADDLDGSIPNRPKRAWQGLEQPHSTVTDLQRK
jgi:hypothetical protein